MAAEGITAEDVKRNRELFRYVIPDDLLVRESPPVGEQGDLPQSISSAMHPYCQLTALRCETPKVMLNVMDLDRMYFLAQASVGLDGVSIEQDPVLQACSAAVPLAGRVCEMTIRMAANPNALPIFTVPDLADSIFKNLAVVCGPPFFRFYAGTPITTKSGVRIGSLAVLDTKPRQGLTVEQEAFLGRTSRQIMDLLETRRYASEGRRAVRLGRSLEAFTSGKATMSTVEPRSTSYGLPHRDQDSARPKQRLYSVVDEKTFLPDESEITDRQTSENSNKQSSVEQSVPQMFSRAADLLREGFDDTGDKVEVNFVSLNNVELSRHTENFTNPDTSGERRQALFRQTTFVATSPTQSHAEIDLPHGLVASLVQRYPSGCLFDLDDLSCYSPLDTDESKENWLFPKTDRNTSLGELGRIEALRDAFPHARQILFAPLWDSDRASFAYAAFVVSPAETTSLSTSTDLSFLNAFCCSLMAECSRIEAARSQKQKADFVGTMSHEMRSPLHGILASVEFLSETSLDTYQQSLVGTVQSCGRTLLDTINHVLDFSKINTYRKSWQATNHRTKGLQKKNSRTPDAAAPALLQMTDIIQVAAVVEEVVDTLVTGQEFSPSVDVVGLDSSSARNAPKHEHPVKILLDIQNANWTFLTQPGAIRRIVINLTGNAMKYTTQGSVTIRLEQHTSGEEDVMTLTVVDTGCGISKHFIDSKLFTPFSQENVLAPGTGLGLSIVQNIVTMLDGTINVSSEVGKGTSFRVVLPLQRPLPGQYSTTTTPSSGSTASSARPNPQAYVEHVVSQMTHRRVTLSVSDRDLETSVRSLLTQWFKLEVVSENADVCIIDEERLRRADYPSDSIILVIGSLAQQRHWHGIANEVEFVSMPVGPYRLARSICAAFSRYNSAPRSIRGSIDLQPIPEHGPGDDISDSLREIDLGHQRNGELSRIVQATESLFVAKDSLEAQNVIHSSKDEGGVSLTDESDSFPFEKQRKASSSAISPATEMKSTTLLDGDIASPEAVPAPTHNHQPRVLVVDDNRINLTLLKNFLIRKRKYVDVDSAEDGCEALNNFTTDGKAYDIVFMDISMPIMNGFEATRAIRSFEAERSSGTSGALIVALTGLAGGRDQAEAFDAGVDIYMTKPVSFKLVAELLDNWESKKKLSRWSHEKLAKELLGDSINLVRSEDAFGALVGRNGVQGAGQTSDV